MYSLVIDYKFPLYTNHMYIVLHTCTAVDCGAPEDLANGMIRALYTVYRSVITYSCDYGYILIGVQTRTCQEDGRWSGQSPTCAGNAKN